MNIPSIISILKKYNIRPQKRFGQNFLTEFSIIKKIVEALNLNSTDEVLEIGPGLGVMSALIASRLKKIYAVEKDIILFNLIKKEFLNINNLHLFNKDILKFNIKTDLKEADFPIKVIGNIPYNISTPIIFNLLKQKELISLAILTIQKEVADRITAKEGSKDYGILSIMLQTKANCKKLFDIKPSCFTPAPKVTSSVIKIEFHSKPLPEIKDEKLFENIVKTAFGKRRKTIRNSLSGLKSLDIESLDKALEKAKIDPKRRPETVSIEEYVEFSNVIQQLI